MTATAAFPVTAALGLPETRLPADLLRRLPPQAPPAPWRTHCTMVTWMHLVGQDARLTFPEPIRPGRVELAVWAVVRYDDTPVGPYDEITVTLLPVGGSAGHVPFIAVDSPASIVGGRANWLLPKTLARFAWSSPSHGVEVSAVPPRRWRLNGRWAVTSEAVETSVDSIGVQVGSDGTVGTYQQRITGRMAAATVTVRVKATGQLAELLLPGTHPGSVITDATLTAGPLDLTGDQLAASK